MSDFTIKFKINGSAGNYTKEVPITTAGTLGRAVQDAIDTLTNAEQSLWFQVITTLIIGGMNFQNISSRAYWDKTGAIDPDDVNLFLPPVSNTA